MKISARFDRPHPVVLGARRARSKAAATLSRRWDVAACVTVLPSCVQRAGLAGCLNLPALNRRSLSNRPADWPNPLEPPRDAAASVRRKRPSRKILSPACPAGSPHLPQTPGDLSRRPESWRSSFRPGDIPING